QELQSTRSLWPARRQCGKGSLALRAQAELHLAARELFGRPQRAHVLRGPDLEASDPGQDQSGRVHSVEPAAEGARRRAASPRDRSKDHRSLELSVEGDDLESAFAIGCADMTTTRASALESSILRLPVSKTVIDRARAIEAGRDPFKDLSETKRSKLLDFLIGKLDPALAHGGGKHRRSDVLARSAAVTSLLSIAESS